MGALHCLSKRPRGPTKKMEPGHSQHGCPPGLDCQEAQMIREQNNLPQRKGEGRHFTLGWCGGRSPGLEAGRPGQPQLCPLLPGGSSLHLLGLTHPHLWNGGDTHLPRLGAGYSH